MQRCLWATDTNALMQAYHDNEWNISIDDDQKLFEVLSLETYQAGLSWQTVLNKRDAFRKQFNNYDLNWVAKQTTKFVDEALLNTNIIRHRGKIEATINNANCILSIHQEGGSFANFLTLLLDANATLPLPQLSDMLTKALKKKGFKFVGTTTATSFILAAGFVNGHESQCFKYPGKI